MMETQWSGGMGAEYLTWKASVRRILQSLQSKDLGTGERLR
jgi:hypothetical protein